MFWYLVGGMSVSTVRSRTVLLRDHHYSSRFALILFVVCLLCFALKVCCEVFFDRSAVHLCSSATMRPAERLLPAVTLQPIIRNDSR